MSLTGSRTDLKPKDNIVFGSEYEEARYKKGMKSSKSNRGLSDRIIVLYQCGLEHDLQLFDAGDLTEVGEKGLTLRFVMYSSDAAPIFIAHSVADRRYEPFDMIRI